MAGRPTHTQTLSDFLQEPIEAACIVTRPERFTTQVDIARHDGRMRCSVAHAFAVA
jgi:hypothetical protein